MIGGQLQPAVSFKCFFSCFSSFLVISAAALSAWTVYLLHDIQILLWYLFSLLGQAFLNLFEFSPDTLVQPSEKLSICEEVPHLFARGLERQPLFLAIAWSVKAGWKISLCSGVLTLVFRALEAWSFAGPRESVRHQYAPFSFMCVCVCVCVCGIFVPWPRIEPGSLAVEAWSPNHWTSREFPVVLTLN